MPRALLEDLQVGVNVLVDDIRCPVATVPATTAEEDEDEPRGKGHDRKKGRGHHGKRGGRG